MTNSINPSDYSDIGLRVNNGPVQREIKKELGQADFLALLTTQLANQDPLAPTDSKEFISQMTQFASLDAEQSMVNQLTDLATALTSNQALQASALVGRNVLIDGNESYLHEGGVIAGQPNLDSTTTNIRFEVRDASGQTVRSISVGTQEAGDLDFIWDGNNDLGDRMPPGVYTVAAFGQVGGASEQLRTSVIARVESVNLAGADGQIVLNLAGLGQIGFNDVKEIG